MLLILQPLAFVTFSIGESINAIALTLSFDVFAFVSVARLEDGFTLPIRLAALHFAIIDRAVLESIGTNNDFRRKNSLQLVKEAALALGHDPLREAGAYERYIETFYFHAG